MKAIMTYVRGILGLAIVFAAAPLHAQWDSITKDPTHPVIAEGFLALHDDGASLQAFSAMAQTWRMIGATGSSISGTGDWTVLFDQPGSLGLTAYSARLHETAIAPLSAGTILSMTVADDVILIINDLGGMYEASAYSAQTNTWDQVILNEVPQVAVSRFVVVLYAPFGGRVYGFGAREAYWTSQDVNVCRPPAADGNCAALIHIDAVGTGTVLAFSGITNEFSSSDPAPTLSFQIDHDVVFTNYEQPGLHRSAGFSAYTGLWVPSSSTFNSTDIVSVQLRDKLILVETTSSPQFEAIGALPQTAWSGLSGPGLAVEGLSEDSVVVSDSGNPVMHAFSGLNPGNWVSEAAVGPFVYEGTPEHFSLVRDASFRFHAFSPILGSWAAQNLAGSTARVGDCVAAIVTPSGDAIAWSSRWNTWEMASPPDASSSYGFHVAGSVLARTSGPTGASTSVEFFDERANVWTLGLPLMGAGPTPLIGLRNASSLIDGTALLGFSAQRADLLPAPTGGSAITSLIHEENILVVEDASGGLHAMGSPGATHAIYDYPLDTEVHHWSSPVPGADTEVVRFTVKAPPGVGSIIGVSSNPFFPGIPIGFGVLYIAPPLDVLMFGLPAGAGGVSTGDIPISPGAGPFQAWAQAARLSPIQLLGRNPASVLVL